MDRTLTELHTSMDQLDHLIAQHEGNVDDPAIVEILTNWLAGDVVDFTVKADAYLSLVEEMMLRAQARKSAAERLQKLVKADENAAKKLKARLLYVLVARGVAKMDTARYRIYTQNNPPSVEIDEGCYAPSEYYEWGEPKLKKKELLDAMKAGHQFPGCHIKQEKSVRFR